MKKIQNIQRTAWICAAAVLLLILTAVVLQTSFQSAPVEAKASSSETEQYIIGVYEEKIAVFAQGDSIPIDVYNVYVNTLPEADRTALRNGIEVSGKARLRELIEDYTS